MSRNTFASVRSLISGRGLPEAREDDEESGQGGGSAGPVAGPTEAQLNALVADERAAASKDATAAANARWNAAMTSDAGRARPKAAAHLLNTTSMSADEVQATIAAFDDDKPQGSDAAAASQTAAQNQREQDRAALAGDADTRVDTGGAASAPSARKGEGERAGASGLREQRNARAKRRNPQGGKRVNQE
jgi:hypothetical protein